MIMDETDKMTLNVPGFPVRVLGGTFVVKEIMLGKSESREQVLSLIHATAEDRWFVMVSDDAGGEMDALAMLDDDLEVQIYAHGVLRQD